MTINGVDAAVTNEQYRLCTRCGNGGELDGEQETAARAEAAVKKCRDLAEQGLAAAKLVLGIRYAKGWGVNKDYQAAMKWFHEASYTKDKNEATIKSINASWGIESSFASSKEVAEYNIGVMFANGWGREVDMKTAMSHFDIAAREGPREAQLAVGDMYANGYGVEKDDKVALKWYGKAASQGDETAQRKAKEIKTKLHKTTE